MLKTLLKTSASKTAIRDPPGLQAIITIAWNYGVIDILSSMKKYDEKSNIMKAKRLTKPGMPI